MFRSRTQLAAENLFLRKQLACYVERRIRPRRNDLLPMSPEWTPRIWRRRPDLNRGWRFCRYRGVVDVDAWLRLLVPDSTWFFGGVWAFLLRSCSEALLNFAPSLSSDDRVDGVLHVGIVTYRGDVTRVISFPAREPE
jgi:hypothetical protein